MAKRRAYIKSLDPQQTVTTGEEGFPNVSDGVKNGTGVNGGYEGSRLRISPGLTQSTLGRFERILLGGRLSFESVPTWTKEHDSTLR